jgi:hypothetical protein
MHNISHRQKDVYLGNKLDRVHERKRSKQRTIVKESESEWEGRRREEKKEREREKKAATKASPERSVARVDLCGFQAVWHSGLQVENN